jgi:hypothetical protein
MEPAFVSWKSRSVKNGAAVTDLQGVDRVYAMMDGESFKDVFPLGAAFHFNPDFKRDTLLVDCLINIENMLVVSERLKNFIQGKNPDKVEYLPVTVHDHKGKAVADPYFIIHPIDPPDCIDFPKSNVTWSQMDTSSIQFVDHLEIDATKVAPSRLLFRAKAYPGAILLRREFALEIEAAGFKGAGWRAVP